MQSADVGIDRDHPDELVIRANRRRAGRKPDRPVIRMANDHHGTQHGLSAQRAYGGNVLRGKGCAVRSFNTMLPPAVDGRVRAHLLAKAEKLPGGIVHPGDTFIRGVDHHAFGDRGDGGIQLGGAVLRLRLTDAAAAPATHAAW